MNHLKTFESFGDNTELTEDIISEEFNDIKSKIDHFLESPTDESIADKLLHICFVSVFSNHATAPFKKIVDKLPIEEKLRLLKDAREKLEYSPVTSLRLMQTPITKTLNVGSISKKVKTES